MPSGMAARMVRPEAPKVGISACMQGQNVRYDGGHKRYPFYPILAANFQLIPFCPEAAAGLGVPRPPMDLQVRENGNILAISHADEERPVDRLVRQASQVFASQHCDLAAYIHMNRSPSCARGDAKVYDRNERLAGRFDGIFTQELDRALKRLLVCSDFETLLRPTQLLAFIEEVLSHDLTGNPLPPGSRFLDKLRKIHDQTEPAEVVSRITGELSANGIRVPPECAEALCDGLRNEWEKDSLWTF